jgi:hypothetical protein
MMDMARNLEGDPDSRKFIGNDSPYGVQGVATLAEEPSNDTLQQFFIRSFMNLVSRPTAFDLANSPAVSAP